jgi:Na+-translocating ferredoxin:NAD+ oxidoreductase RnfG subunit
MRVKRRTLRIIRIKGSIDVMSRPPPSPWLAVPLLVTPLAAQATQYLSIEQAQRLLFPSATDYASQAAELTAEQVRAIEQASGTRVVNRRPKVWRATAGDTLLGHVFVDQVYGKHEFITYALAVTADGQVAGVEILDYRETHGDQVRQPRWRAQFLGKDADDAVKLGRDIQNISGATLSCRHLTDGVRRLLATHRALLAAQP